MYPHHTYLYTYLMADSRTCLSLLSLCKCNEKASTPWRMGVPTVELSALFPVRVV